jgi:hypothetical protein
VEEVVVSNSSFRGAAPKPEGRRRANPESRSGFEFSNFEQSDTMGVTNPWTAEALAEDARRLEEFERTREGVPWDEVRAWMQSWGTGRELPPPKPRKL